MNKLFTTLCAALFLLPWGILRAESGSCGLPLPQNGYRVSSPYGMRVHPLARVRRMHVGVDLACPKGTPVRAVRGGVVVFAGRSGCYGKVLMLRHSGDVITLYAHLSRIPGLRPGMVVREGDVIGLVGATGCVTGSHLHFEWWESGQRVNPALRCAALRSRVKQKRKRKGDDEMVAFAKDLDAPLLRLSSQDDFTLEDATKGVHAFGGIGSGKTSGSGKVLAGAYLRAGFGGLITAVKPEEVDLWRRYVREHGREKSLIVFDESEGFNFLSYEMARQGFAGIGTLTECLMRVLEAAKRASPTASQQGGEAAIWEDGKRQLLRYTLPTLYSATGTLTISDIIRFINTAPGSVKDVTNPEWQKGSFMYRVMDAATRQPKVPLPKETLTDIINFWGEAYPAIPDKTRGGMVITVTAALDRFKHGRLNRVFCRDTSIVPELSFHGAVIVLAMPTLTWNEDGVIAQMLFKYMWQRAVLGRNSLAQETVHSYDGEFIGMARGSKCCPVFLTQSLPTYYAKMGGSTGRDEAHGLVGKFMTHIYHSNACPETNEYASRMIGKVVTRRSNFSAGNSQSVNEGMSAGNNENTGNSSSFGSSGQSFSSNSGSNSGSGNNWGDNRGRSSTDNVSRGYSENMEYVIEPGEFARILKTGGRANGNIVTGVWFQSGRVFGASGGNMMLRRFAQ